MNLFAKQLAFIDNFEKMLFTQLGQAISANHLVLKDYIIEKQLYDKGIDGNKARLPGYKRTTIRMKIAAGQPADRTTLKDSGKFHASINIEAFADRFEISSNVSYDKYIIQRYKKPVLKVTDENFKEFLNKFFLPKLKNYVNNKFAK